MKANSNQMSKSLTLFLLTMLSFGAFSQGKTEKTRIRIEQEVDGKTTISEKIINSSDLSSSQRDEMIEQFKDSVLALNKGKARGVKIEIDNGSNSNINIEHTDGHFDNEKVDIDISREKPRVRVYKKNDKNYGEHFDSDEFTHELNGSMESLRENMKQMGKELKFDFRTIPEGFPFNDSNVGKTIKRVDVFLNNPKTEILNVRFNAPQKGDVSIKVLDVKGNVVSREEIKDFSGDYVGQINIGKQKAGTIFVMITQGEDGTVKRIVLPPNE